MVVSPIGIYPLDSFIIGDFCRFSSGSIHIFSVLMKKIFKYMNQVARPINKAVVWMALLLTYFVICLYHFMLHQKAQRWIYNKNKVSLEQTKHLW